MNVTGIFRGQSQQKNSTGPSDMGHAKTSLLRQRASGRPWPFLQHRFRHSVFGASLDSTVSHSSCDAVFLASCQLNQDI